MKKTISKPQRQKHGHKRRMEKPLELDRGWQELEQQHDRLRSDWTSLCAQLGVGGRERSHFG